MKNAELIRRFTAGDGHGSASRMEITQGFDGSTFLWDYGWALLAHRDPSGDITVYDGWLGYSSTTTKHVRFFKPDEASYAVCSANSYVDAQPKVPRGWGSGSFDPDGREELERFSEDIAP